MDENGLNSYPETLLCGQCGSPYDLEDNFCRECGLALHDTQLPSVRDKPGLPAVWRPPVPAAVVKGAAFVAAGTVAEMLVRRMVKGAFGRRSDGSKEPSKRAKGEIVPQEDSPNGEAQMVSETFLMRRIRFRR